MIAILLSALVAALAAAYALIIKRRRSEGPAAPPKPPGPRPLPIIGSTHLIGRETSPFVGFTKLAEEYGDIYSLKLGTAKCVVVSGMTTIRSVLMQNGKFMGGRPDFIRYHKLFADDRQNSLALCDWCDLQIKRRQIARKFCDPRNASPLRKTMADVGALEMREFVGTLKAKSAIARSQGRDLSLKPIIASTCLNIFAQYMCSMRFDAEHDAEFNHIARLFDEIFWEINQGYAVDFFPWLLPFYGAHMRKLAGWSTTIRAFILSRIIDMRETNLDDDEEERDFTDGLLKALKHETVFTREAILFTLEDFLGGSSAVGNLTMLVLTMCAQRPDIAARIQRELDEVTAGGQRPIELGDSENMPYATACIRETLRYFSSPIVPHVATENAVVAGHTIEKGSVVIINNYKMNMNEELWEKPEEFSPDRFLNRTYVEVKSERRGSDQDSGVDSDEEKSSSDDASSQSPIVEKTRKKIEVLSLKNNMPHFMPFSIGKRTCLGRGMVLNYALLILASIMQNFDVTCKNPESIKTYTACVALPPEPYGLTLTPRRCC